MPIAVTDPLHALSLARTALSDPAALPSNSDFDPSQHGWKPAHPLHVAYAIEQIDHAIGGLCFEPFDDPTREAGVALANLDRLLSAMAESLDECVGFEGPVARIREAAQHLAGARLLLASTRGDTSL